MEHVAGPVDDGLEELVPGPGRRRQAGHLVQEAELLELVGGAGGSGARPAGWRRPSPDERRGDGGRVGDGSGGPLALDVAS